VQGIPLVARSWPAFQYGKTKVRFLSSRRMPSFQEIQTCTPPHSKHAWYANNRKRRIGLGGAKGQWAKRSRLGA